jgi:hypothetical protein
MARVSIERLFSATFSNVFVISRHDGHLFDLLTTSEYAFSGTSNLSSVSSQSGGLMRARVSVTPAKARSVWMQSSQYSDILFGGGCDGVFSGATLL